MRKGLLFSVFIFIFSSVLWAQTPAPTGTPKPAADDEDVVKISTNLIQVDATVTDKDGKIVTDLKPNEIEIYENDQKQEITNFSFVSNVDTSASTARPTEQKSTDKNAVPLPLPAARLRPEDVHRTISLVVDDLGLSFESMYFVRRALKKFVDEQMQPNDLVAIVRTGSGAGALQQFTSDKSQLYAAIDGLKWNSIGRSGVSAFAPVEATALEATGADQDAIDADNESQKNFDNFREDIFTVGTLGAVNFIVKGMKDLPGRKSIMLFSDGFVICQPGDPDRCIRLKDSLKQLTDLSNRAAVSIYSFDARGLQYTGMTAADNTSGLNNTQIQQRMSARNADLLDKQDGLAFLSDQTGGRAFLNNNDFNKSLDKALEDQKGYYLIGYEPDAETFDPKVRRFNKLSIKVTRPGLKVRYRSGFFGVTDQKMAASILTPAQQIQTALVSPFVANGISLRFNTLFGADPKIGAFVHSYLHIDTKGLQFSNQPDGTHTAKFEVLAVSFGADGQPVDQLSKIYTVTVPNDAFERINQEGIIYNFIFPVKKPGAYQLRVAIRDEGNSKIGTANQFVEVPDLKKNWLTLSGFVLESMTEKQFSEIGTPAAADSERSNPMADTSIRRFKSGSVMRYSLEIYNAKLDQAQKPQIQTQVRVFRDGKMILNGTPRPLVPVPTSNYDRTIFTGALDFGKGMTPGDYVLQAIITDGLAKEKHRVSTQSVEFEITGDK